VQLPALEKLLQSLQSPVSPFFQILTRCPALANREIHLCQADVAQRATQAAASAQQVRVAELLRSLLHKDGIDTTVPMDIISALSTHCGQGATSASVTALVGSLVAWVQVSIADTQVARTQARIHFLGSAAFHALLRALLWGYGIRVRAAASVALELEGETCTASGEQWASMSWALLISKHYMHELDGTAGYFDMREVVAHHAGKELARRNLLGHMHVWRTRVNGVVAAHVPVPGEAALVHLVLDQLALTDSDPGFASQASAGPGIKLLAFAARDHRDTSSPAAAVRTVLRILAAVDARYHCNLAELASAAFEGPAALSLVSLFVRVDLRTVAMTFGRTFPLHLLCEDDVVLPAGLELFCIVVGPCLTEYWYLYWCTPILFAVADAGVFGYVPLAAKSATIHQALLSPQPVKRPLSDALRAAMVAANGDFVAELRLGLQTVAFPPGQTRRGNTGTPWRHGETTLAA
jgi:hypothetical protein